MRNILRPLISLLLVFSLVTSCQETDNKTSPVEDQRDTALPVEFDLEQIIERDTLKAIVDNSSTSYFLYKGQPMGFEYELLKRFCDEIGVILDLVVTSNIEDAFKQLNQGEGDIIAYSLTVTRERKERIAFTHSHLTARQVLVQQKPEGWQRMHPNTIDRKIIRNQIDLIGKEIHVRYSSSYIDRLKNLSDEIGGDIQIVEDVENADTETLIKKVAQGNIKYTVSDEHIALVNATYYPNIDVKTPISFPQQIAWGVRKNAPLLLGRINAWLDKIKEGPLYNIIYNKYFKSTRSSLIRATSEYSSFTGDKISEYDQLIKQAADSLGWDWKLLASVIYQESRFNPIAKSWAGAVGLMQMMPATARRFGVKNRNDPAQSIMGGTLFLKFLDNYWKQYIDNGQERIKFVLASYNVGRGHVIDARALAEKYDKDPNVWEGNVAFYLLEKSKQKFYTDPAVKSGYCKGEEPVKYVRDILLRYDQYRELISA